MLLVFPVSVKETYTSLVVLDPTCALFCIRTLGWASQSSVASKALQKLSPFCVSLSREILYLISSWDYLRWLFQSDSLFISIQWVWTFLESKTGHAYNCILLHDFCPASFSLLSAIFFFYSTLHQYGFLLQIWLQIENNYFSIVGA